MTTPESYVEFAGLTAEAVRLIEELRQSPADTKSQILVRALTPLQRTVARPVPGNGQFVDYKEGIVLPVGEKVYLFLSRGAKLEGKPDAVGEVRLNGLFMDGKFIATSPGRRPFQPGMKIVQNRKKLFSKTNGGTVSLSALRQWCVLRDGKFVTLEELKDPALKRTRGGKIGLEQALKDLDLEF